MLPRQALNPLLTTTAADAPNAKERAAWLQQCKDPGLCYTILCYTVLYCSVLCCAILYYTILYYTRLD